MSFFVELWESIFTPGTSPALLKATHGSFILLLISLLSLIYYTRSIHFINLFVIALLLYASVIWFVKELKSSKLKDNSELGDSEVLKEEPKTATTTSSSSTPAVDSNGKPSSGKIQTARKRKA